MATPTWEDFTLAFELFRDPILCGALAGAGLGLLAVHVVLRRMVFVAASLGQAAGLGVALGFFMEIHLPVHAPPGASALALASLAAWAFTWPLRRLHLSPESVVAAVWLACSAGALVVGAHISQEAHDIAAILFGTAVLVTPGDLLAVALATALALVLGLWWQPALTFVGFDREGARVQGLPVRLLDGVLMALITLEVAAATRALGTLPTFAFSVLPGVTGLMLGGSVRRAVPLAIAAGALSGAGGYLLAFFAELPVGAAQTATAATLALAAALWRAARGGE